MHSVENLTHLYRAQRYRHTPELNQAMRNLFRDFGDRGVFPPDLFPDDYGYQFFSSVFEPIDSAARVFYEPCPVVKITAMEIIVVSQTMPYEITKLYPDFKAGGKFNINKPRLQRDGKALHTRYGEWFHISAPDSAIALGESRELVKV
jgi:hypothetical protein